MIDWNQVDTVFFDMDGTLLDLHFDNYFWLEYLPKRYTELKQLDHQEALTMLHAMYEEHHGSLNWYCLDFWSNALDIDIVELKREVSDKIAYRPYVRDFLLALSQKNLDLAIVTNAHQGSIGLKLKETDLASFFPEIICSHDYGFAKEEPGFWPALQHARSFDPARTAFFDDNEAVLASARAFGIQHLFSIAKPDSQKPGRSTSEYSLVFDFRNLL